MSAAPIFIRAIGLVSCAGTGVGSLRARLAEPGWRPQLHLERPDAPPLPVATCADFSTQGHLPPLVARRLDRSARLLAVAAREAFGGPDEPLPWPRHRVGVSAATGNGGMEALFQVLKAVFLAGPEEAPPMQFPSTVANAAASQLGLLEKLSGPNVTFAEKQAGGLRAVAEAVRLIRHSRADAVLAAAVDEAQWLNAEAYDRARAMRRAGRPGFIPGEGAVAMLLSGEPGPSPLARLAGIGSRSSATTTYRYPTDPDALARACEIAIEAAGVLPAGIDLVMSVANGAPALAALEMEALARIFGRHRPATMAITDRLGEGSFASLLRLAVAGAAIGGVASPLWEAPAHLARAGYPALRERPRVALVAGVAAGGSAIAAVLTPP